MADLKAEGRHARDQETRALVAKEEEIIKSMADDLQRMADDDVWLNEAVPPYLPQSARWTRSRTQTLPRSLAAKTYRWCKR